VARNTTRQGANFELKVMHDLAEHGYTCLRSSGSRGAVDVVAVAPRGYYSPREAHSLCFIQCKITNPVIPPAERLAVQDLALRAGALPLVAFQETDRVTRKVFIKYRQLTGPGPKDWVHWAPGEDN
jgi:Holliday junction resolvase